MDYSNSLLHLFHFTFKYIRGYNALGDKWGGLVLNFHIHIAFGCRVKKFIEKEFDIKLNKTAFLYGNIKPDLNKKVFPHELKYAKDFLYKEIINLSLSDSIDKQKSWEFSERLGVVMHYLADFFCHAHTDLYEGGIIKHSIYEFRQSYYYVKNFRFISNSILKYLGKESKINLLDTFFEKEFNEYISNSPSIARDLIYSFKICASICSLIMDAQDMQQPLFIAAAASR